MVAEYNAIRSSHNILARAESSQDDAKKVQKNLVLQYAEANLNTNLTIDDDNYLVSKIVDYTPTGIYDEGDILSNEDLLRVFTFNYNLLYGYDLSQGISDLTDYQPTETGEISQDVKDSMVKDQKLIGFEAPYATYAPAEIIPGFILKAKIYSKDVMTNSRKCNLTLQLGIAQSGSPDDVT
jgi:hypothetical protein